MNILIVAAIILFIICLFAVMRMYTQSKDTSKSDFTIVVFAVGITLFVPLVQHISFYFGAMAYAKGQVYFKQTIASNGYVQYDLMDKAVEAPPSKVTVFECPADAQIK